MRPWFKNRRVLRLALAIAASGLMADFALADGFFGFRFFTEGLTTLFLLPFQIAGCG